MRTATLRLLLSLKLGEIKQHAPKGIVWTSRRRLGRRLEFSIRKRCVKSGVELVTLSSSKYNLIVSTTRANGLNRSIEGVDRELDNAYWGKTDKGVNSYVYDG